MKDILIETSLVANTILLEENGKVFDNALIYNGFKKNYFYVNIFEDNVLIAKFFWCFLDVKDEKRIYENSVLDAVKNTKEFADKGLVVLDGLIIYKEDYKSDIYENLFKFVKISIKKNFDFNEDFVIYAYSDAPYNDNLPIKNCKSKITKLTEDTYVNLIYEDSNITKN